MGRRIWFSEAKALDGEGWRLRERDEDMDGVLSPSLFLRDDVQ